MAVTWCLIVDWFLLAKYIFCAPLLLLSHARHPLTRNCLPLYLLSALCVCAFVVLLCIQRISKYFHDFYCNRIFLRSLCFFHTRKLTSSGLHPPPPQKKKVCRKKILIEKLFSIFFRVLHRSMPSNWLRWLLCFHRYSNKFMCSSLSRSYGATTKRNWFVR